MNEITTRRHRTKVDPNETPELKFDRLAKSRGNKLVHQMKLLCNLGSYAYKINPELAHELLITFQENLDALKAAWGKATTKKVTKENLEH